MGSGNLDREGTIPARPPRSGTAPEGDTVSNTRSNIPFAERLRAAHEQEQSARRSPLRMGWLRGPRASFAPDVAVEPRDRPRQRDEFVEIIRDAS
jgi:hypothetical protein